MTDKRASLKVKPTVLDIFCGAGGMSLGFEQGGCEILGGIDMNPHAIATHHHNFPNSRLKLPAQDIRECQLDQLGLTPGELDIIVGGPPCQVFSRVGIGKMKSLGTDTDADHRNFLYKEFVRFVGYYKPLCFVMENVDNLANKKDTITKIQEDFSQLGYRVSYQVLDASEFGVPQRRMRLFVIGIRSDLALEPTFPLKESSRPVSVGEAISDLPLLKPFVTTLQKKTSSGPKQKDVEQPYNCSSNSFYQEKMRSSKQEGEGVWNHLCRSHNDKDIAIFEVLAQGGKYRDIPKEMMRYRVDIFDDKYRRLVWDKPSWTLTAHLKKDGLAYIHPLQNRSISVREAARLQSFPDDFNFVAPMTRMFELIGNSVPPLLAEAVAKPLVQLIKSYRKEQEVC